MRQSQALDGVVAVWAPESRRDMPAAGGRETEMIKAKYPFYALAIVAVGGIAFWAGLPPSLLIVLLVCPLMMLLMMSMMMRGPNSGQENGSSPDRSGTTGLPYSNSYKGSSSQPAVDSRRIS